MFVINGAYAPNPLPSLVHTCEKVPRTHQRKIANQKCTKIIITKNMRIIKHPVMGRMRFTCG